MFLKLSNAIECLKELDDYIMDIIENPNNEDEDEKKASVARILENNGMYNHVRKDERND